MKYLKYFNESLNNLPSLDEVKEYFLPLEDDSTRSHIDKAYIDDKGKIALISENGDFDYYTKNRRHCGYVLFYKTKLDDKNIEALLVENIFYNIKIEYPNLYLYIHFFFTERIESDNHYDIRIAITDEPIRSDMNAFYANDKEYKNNKLVNKTPTSFVNENITEGLPTFEEIKDYLLPLEDEADRSYILDVYLYKDEIELLDEDTPFAMAGRIFCGIAFSYDITIKKEEAEKILEHIFSNILDEYPNTYLYYGTPSNTTINVIILDREVDAKLNFMKQYKNNKFINESVSLDFKNLPSLDRLKEYFLSIEDESRSSYFSYLLNRSAHKYTLSVRPVVINNYNDGNIIGYRFSYNLPLHYSKEDVGNNLFNNIFTNLLFDYNLDIYYKLYEDSIIILIIDASIPEETKEEVVGSKNGNIVHNSLRPENNGIIKYEPTQKVYENIKGFYSELPSKNEMEDYLLPLTDLNPMNWSVSYYTKNTKHEKVYILKRAIRYDIDRHYNDNQEIGLGRFEKVICCNAGIVFKQPISDLNEVAEHVLFNMRNDISKDVIIYYSVNTFNPSVSIIMVCKEDLEDFTTEVMKGLKGNGFKIYD